MFELSYLTEPTLTQKQQILGVYHDQGWWPESTNDPERVQRVISGSHCFVAAFEGQELAGFGRALSDRTGDAYIHDVTVRKPFRHQGLGHRIISMLISRLKQDGITWIALIAEQNSHAFYNKNDFQIMENATPMFKWVI